MSDPRRSLPLDDLYRTHRDRVATVALRVLGDVGLADEVTQDVFVQACRGVHRLREPLAARRWLARAAVREARRRLRRRTWARWVGRDTALERGSIAPDAKAEERATLTKAYARLDRLPIAQRVAWTLRYFEGAALPEVAALCGCSEARAGRRVAAAHARMRALFEGAPASTGAPNAAEKHALALGQRIRRAMDPATAAVDLARIQRRDRARHTRSAVLVVALTLGGLGWVTQTSPRPPHLALADGTTVHALSDDLDVVLREATAATLFELAQGDGRFDVAHRTDRRPVRVQAGAVVIEARGARFEVRRAPDQVAVTVLSGEVRVRAPAGRVVLSAGERVVLAPRAPER